MIPQKQTIFTDVQNDIKGNCFTACLASLLDIPIEQVPYFPPYEDDWFDIFLSFLETNNFEFKGIFDISTTPQWKEFKGIDGYVIVGGKSPRNVNNHHGVIYKLGEPYFDPHPDNTFITEEEDVWLIERSI